MTFHEFEKLGISWFRLLVGAISGYAIYYLCKRAIWFIGTENSGKGYNRMSVQHDGGPPLVKSNDRHFPVRKIKVYLKSIFIGQMYDWEFSWDDMPKRLDWMLRMKPRTIVFNLDCQQPIQPQYELFYFLTECMFNPKRAHQNYRHMINRMEKLDKFRKHTYIPKNLVFTLNRSESLAESELRQRLHPFMSTPYPGTNYNLIQVWGTNGVKILHKDQLTFRTIYNRDRIMTNRDDFMDAINPQVN